MIINDLSCNPACGIGLEAHRRPDFTVNLDGKTLNRCYVLCWAAEKQVDYPALGLVGYLTSYQTPRMPASHKLCTVHFCLDLDRYQHGSYIGRWHRCIMLDRLSECISDETASLIAGHFRGLHAHPNTVIQGLLLKRRELRQTASHCPINEPGMGNSPLTQRRYCLYVKRWPNI